MVNRLEEIRKEKDRAEEEYSEAIRDTVRALRKENPMWTIKKIADTVNLTRQRVHQLLQPPKPPKEVRELSVVELKCGYCGITFERLERIHLERQARGAKATFCSGTCQKAGFVQSHRITVPRTECSEGHLLSASNTAFVKTTTASGKVYQGRRCRTCRNIYARAYYKNKKRMLQELADDNGTE